MRTTLLIVACFSASLAFAFLAAGFCAVAGLDDSEISNFAQRIKKPRPRGVLSNIGSFLAVTVQADRELLARLGSHWRTRPEARWLIRVGVAFFLVAIGLGSWLIATASA